MSGSAGDALGTSLLFDVFALHHSVGRLLADALGDGPLTPAEYATYSAIFELEAASPTQLSRRLGMQLTTFMDQLHLLERRGHARRLDNPGDRRSYLVTLTAGGLQAHREANAQFERAYRAFIGGLGVAEADARESLRAMRLAAESALEHRALTPTRRQETAEESARRGAVIGRA